MKFSIPSRLKVSTFELFRFNGPSGRWDLRVGFENLLDDFLHFFNFERLGQEPAIILFKKGTSFIADRVSRNEDDAVGQAWMLFNRIVFVTGDTVSNETRRRCGWPGVDAVPLSS